jgi:hypothetical protein
MYEDYEMLEGGLWAGSSPGVWPASQWKRIKWSPSFCQIPPITQGVPDICGPTRTKLQNTENTFIALFEKFVTVTCMKGRRDAYTEEHLIFIFLLGGGHFLKKY